MRTTRLGGTVGKALTVRYGRMGEEGMAGPSANRRRVLQNGGCGVS